MNGQPYEKTDINAIDVSYFYGPAYDGTSIIKWDWLRYAGTLAVAYYFVRRASSAPTRRRNPVGVKRARAKDSPKQVRAQFDELLPYAHRPHVQTAILQLIEQAAMREAYLDEIDANRDNWPSPTLRAWQRVINHMMGRLQRDRPALMPRAFEAQERGINAGVDAAA